MCTIDIAIINYNTCELLRNCLKSIYENRPGHVIVVDNASSDGSTTMVKTEFSNCQLITNETNEGYSRAANQAVRASTSKYVLLLNSDTRLSPETLPAISKFLDLHPKVGIAGPRIVGFDGQLQRSCFPFPTLLFLFLEFTSFYRLISLIPLMREISSRTWSYNRPRAVPWVLGAALAIRREAFDSINGFDQNFFMYFEETDLCYRMWRDGWQIYFTPAAEVIHLGGASTQQRQTEMVVQFYLSLAHFYDQHYAPMHAAGMVIMVRIATLARWLRDQTAIRFISNTQHRKMLLNNLAAWKVILCSRWERQ